jgi:hypothetical protein
MGDQFAARLDAVFGGLGAAGGAKEPLWQVSGKQLTRPGRETGYSSEEDDAPEPLMKGDVMASDEEEDAGLDCRMAPSAAYSKWARPAGCRSR